jgi:hypothetical protein
MPVLVKLDQDLHLNLESQTTTLRQLLRARIDAEVSRYNSQLPEVFVGLVQPEESEQLLNGYRLPHRRPLDVERHFQRACESFAHNGFLVLLDGEQIMDLDQSLHLGTQPDLQFLKLVPLIGG